jgi:hypothetical protein
MLCTVTVLFQFAVFAATFRAISNKNPNLKTDFCLLSQPVLTAPNFFTQNAPRLATGWRRFQFLCFFKSESSVCGTPWTVVGIFLGGVNRGDLVTCGGRTQSDDPLSAQPFLLAAPPAAVIITRGRNTARAFQSIFSLHIRSDVSSHGVSIRVGVETNCRRSEAVRASPHRCIFIAALSIMSQMDLMLGPGTGILSMKMAISLQMCPLPPFKGCMRLSC